MSRLVALFLVLTVSATSYGKNINLFSTSLGGRIVGGENTTIEEHPYQVSIEVGELGHWCGGSLIRPDVVLTAAHCLPFLVKWYLVRAGSTILLEGGQIAGALDVCKHPNYVPGDYDIALIKLDKSFQLNSKVQLIVLQNAGEVVPVGTMSTVTGWGALEWQGGGPINLQKVEIPKVDHKICEEQYSSIKNVSDRMDCYGYLEGGRSACQGDSGGPLVASGKQAGIVSFGYECARPNKPGVYTSLENEEIHDHINNCLSKFDAQ